MQYRVAGEGGVSVTSRLRQGVYHRITLGQAPPLGLKQAREQARALLQTASEGYDPRTERHPFRPAIRLR